jgi:hypothetical protein
MTTNMTDLFTRLLKNQMIKMFDAIAHSGEVEKATLFILTYLVLIVYLLNNDHLF